MGCEHCSARTLVGRACAILANRAIHRGVIDRRVPGEPRIRQRDQTAVGVDRTAIEGVCGRAEPIVGEVAVGHRDRSRDRFDQAGRDEHCTTTGCNVVPEHTVLADDLCGRHATAITVAGPIAQRDVLERDGQAGGIEDLMTTRRIGFNLLTVDDHAGVQGHLGRRGGLVGRRVVLTEDGEVVLRRRHHDGGLAIGAGTHMDDVVGNGTSHCVGDRGVGGGYTRATVTFDVHAVGSARRLVFVGPGIALGALRAGHATFVNAHCASTRKIRRNGVEGNTASAGGNDGIERETGKDSGGHQVRAPEWERIWHHKSERFHRRRLSGATAIRGEVASAVGEFPCIAGTTQGNAITVHIGKDRVRDGRCRCTRCTRGTETRHPDRRAIERAVAVERRVQDVECAGAQMDRSTGAVTMVRYEAGVGHLHRAAVRVDPSTGSCEVDEHGRALQAHSAAGAHGSDATPDRGLLRRKKLHRKRCGEIAEAVERHRRVHQYNPAKRCRADDGTAKTLVGAVETKGRAGGFDVWCVDGASRPGGSVVSEDGVGCVHAAGGEDRTAACHRVVCVELRAGQCNIRVESHGNPALAEPGSRGGLNVSGVHSSTMNGRLIPGEGRVLDHDQRTRGIDGAAVNGTPMCQLNGVERERRHGRSNGDQPMARRAGIDIVLQRVDVGLQLRPGSRV
ncbi:unannotated protein [freshwater metagenome]|uniref:Unannotated protein n=1 Tax=freshwater metagenome TaxID=449393 RepID=A0A6J7EBS7_9ZZZZ